MLRAFLQFACILAWAGSVCFAADAPLEPVRVCEILAKPDAYDGKVLAVVGRFSFRENGRLVSEERCDLPPKDPDAAWPTTFRIVFNDKTGPKAPPVFDIDATVLDRKLQAVKSHTALGKFRFGSVDYDGWAVVYGRVEFRRDLKTPPDPVLAKKNPIETAPAQLVCRGEGMILFVRDN